VALVATCCADCGPFSRSSKLAGEPGSCENRRGVGPCGCDHMCVRWACVVGVPGFVQSMHADGGLLPPPRLRSPLLLFFFLLFVRRRESLSLEEERLRLRLAILALRRQKPFDSVCVFMFMARVRVRASRCVGSAVGAPPRGVGVHVWGSRHGTRH